MTFQFVDNLDSLDSLQSVFYSASEGMFLVDRKLRVKLTNPVVEQMVGKPDGDLVSLTIGQVLSCIHIGDHADGCGYGSICGDCFLVNAIKQAIKGKKEVADIAGKLPIGIDGILKRPKLTVSAFPLTYRGRWHAVTSVVDVEQVIRQRT